jgi:hypothetical protein
MRSRLGSIAGFVAVAVVGVLLFVGYLTLHQTPRAWTVGVQAGGVVATLKGDQTICQAPLDVPKGGTFDRVRLRLGTFRLAGPGLDVFVRGRSRGVLARGVLAGGYPDITAQNPTKVVALDHTIRAGTHGISVCVRNGGPGRVALYGNGDTANPTSTATVDGRPAGADVDMIFEREPHSYASELGTILSRATLFRAPRVSGAVYFILLLLLVGIAFGGIGFALRDVASGPDGPDSEA